MQSQEQLEIELYTIGELTVWSEALDAITTDVIQMETESINTLSGRNTAFELLGLSQVPPMDGLMYNMWYAAGDGQKYMDILYHPFNVQAFPVIRWQNQFGGHSKFPIQSIEDMQNKRFRMGAGIPQEVLKRIGVDAMWCAGSEMYSSMDRGVIDITKWGGPEENWGWKFHEVADYAFWPGWQTPGMVMGMEINKERWDGLPERLQSLIIANTRAMSWRVSGSEPVKDAEYFQKFLDYGVTMTRLDDASIREIQEVANQVMEEYADANPMYKEVHENQLEFLKAYAKMKECSQVPFLLSD